MILVNLFKVKGGHGDVPQPDARKPRERDHRNDVSFISDPEGIRIGSACVARQPASGQLPGRGRGRRAEAAPTRDALQFGKQAT
jgi:hypothetical protein